MRKLFFCFFFREKREKTRKFPTEFIVTYWIFTMLMRFVKNGVDAVRFLHGC